MNHWILILMLAADFSTCTEPKTTSAAVAESTMDAPMESISIPIDTTWTNVIHKSNDEWKKILTAEQYHITREQGTERPFTHDFADNHDEGVYVCISCNNPLFSSKTKFNSGTGWPSYYAPYFSRSVKVSTDGSLGMVRDEISCARCDAHLGHVFNDGPKPTGLRYCMDGVALKFEKKGMASKTIGSGNAKAVFAAGCFWCMEAVFESIKGVKDVTSGYSGGTEKNPTYEEVGSGTTGHAEAIEVTYDPSIIKYADLVRVFFAAQNPTQVNGQGPDHGTQYRTIAFYNNDDEKKIINDYIKMISPKFSKPVAAQVVPTGIFWKAEDYHQDYVKHHPENPYVQNESLPRLKRSLDQLKDLVKLGAM